jgi:hypothetical protein
LIRKNTCMSLWSFQGAREHSPPTENTASRRGLSKLNSVQVSSRSSRPKRGRHCF